jgi:uncharacterized protein
VTIWYNAFRFGKTQSRKYLDSLLAKLPGPESIRRSWLHRWFGEGVLRQEFWVPTRYSLAMGIAVGWFFGLLPFFGLQITFSLVLGFFLRCHFPTAVLGTFISNPLTTPAILILQYGFGKWICRLCNLDILSASTLWPSVMNHGIPLLIGAVVSALAMAIIGYGLIWMVWGINERAGQKAQGVV